MKVYTRTRTSEHGTPTDHVLGEDMRRFYLALPNGSELTILADSNDGIKIIADTRITLYCGAPNMIVLRQED